MAKINETLKQLRLDHGMTQEEVAEQVGLTRQAVSSYESGRTQPGLDILERLAQVYEVELTDIIYGRNQGIRLYNGLKITSIVMTCVFLAVQLAGSVLMWIANQFFSLAPGAMTEAEKVTWVTRGKLMDAWTALDGLYQGLFPLCCVALLVLALCLHRPLSIKTKALSVLSFAVASMVVVLPWALSDPFYPPVNYLTTPLLCLAQLVFFLLVSLLIDWLRARKLRRDGDICEENESPQKRGYAPVYKRWWFWLLIAVTATLILWLAVLVSGPISIASPVTEEIQQVENPAFTLNGIEYPQNPTMQDLISRGWKRGKSVAKSGKYSEEKGVTELVDRSYRMTSGEAYITASLDVDQLRSGIDWNECQLVGLSFYVKNIMSFCVNDVELVGINRNELVSLMGEPNKIDGPRNYTYRLTEKGIKLMVTFNGDMINQILVDFNPDLW